VRFVYENYNATAFRIEVNQVLFEFSQGNRDPALGKIDIEIVRNRMQDFVTIEGWIREVDNLNMLRKALHEHSAKHRLATADFARNLDYAFIVKDRVEKRIERRAPVRPVKKEIGMRGDPEGGLVQPEMV